LPFRHARVPRRLITDHDSLFEAHRWAANLRILEIDEIKTVPNVPMSHPFVERLIRTMRREFLDHILFWNAQDLERKLADFQAYYNSARCHGSLGGYTPLSFDSGHTVPLADLRHVRWVSHCRDLVPASRRRLTTNSRSAVRYWGKGQVSAAKDRGGASGPAAAALGYCDLPPICTSNPSGSWT
jgi:hypothetical protein